MEVEVLLAAVGQDRRRWMAAIVELPSERRDAYFLPEYLRPFECHGVEACCAVFRANDAVMVYPFLMSSIPRQEGAPEIETLYDIQSAYGYGGPAVNTAGEDQLFLAEAWNRFSEWCSVNRVVSEFVRFHPLLGNERWAPKAMKVFKERTTVPIMLESYPSAVWKSSYYRVHRQMLRKAERSGFTFHVLPAWGELSWFVPLYEETQESLQGGNETRFGVGYFRALIEGFGTRAWLGVTKQSDEITAAVLVLEGASYLHSHLMGYRRGMQTAGMTNLVYHGIALEGAKRKMTVLHMGGGRTSDEDDSLFRFKKSLSPERSAFWLGTQCHDQGLYDELGKRWEELNGPRPENYLQFYHLPGPS